MRAIITPRAMPRARPFGQPTSRPMVSANGSSARMTAGRSRPEHRRAAAEVFGEGLAPADEDDDAARFPASGGAADAADQRVERDPALEQMGDLEVGRADPMHHLDGGAMGVERGRARRGRRPRRSRRSAAGPGRRRHCSPAAAASGAKQRTDASEPCATVRGFGAADVDALADRALQDWRPGRRSKLIIAGTGRSPLEAAASGRATAPACLAHLASGIRPQTRWRPQACALEQSVIAAARSASRRPALGLDDRVARRSVGDAALRLARGIGRGRSPLAATITIVKLMIAITHGVGPREPLLRGAAAARRRRACALQPRAEHQRFPALRGGCAERRSDRCSSYRDARAGSSAHRASPEMSPRSWVATTTVVPSRFKRGEQMQQPLGHLRIDVAGRLVGDQQLGPVDHRAGDRDALLLPARQSRRPGAGAVGEADPGEHLA
jgi:hypothetical protein